VIYASSMAGIFMGIQWFVVQDQTLPCTNQRNSRAEPVYRYVPLKSEKSFRVLVLEKGLPEEPIACSLREISSFQEEEYEALSYAWGEATSAHQELIMCNDREVHIQTNLASALRALRRRNRPRVLWADAICINQQDPLEKARQVPFMRDIYANAREVIIWLGEEHHSDRNAFQFLHWLFLHFNKQGNKVHREVVEVPSENMWEQVKFEQHHNFGSLKALLGRDWFTRTWVVQELASAQSAVLTWGNESIPWDIVSDVFTKLRHPSFMVNDMEDSKTQASLNSLLAMETARRSVNGTLLLSLFQILLGTCFNLCSDPKDKIYAVMGMAKDWREKGELDPDYSATTTAEEVFKRFAIWDIQKNGTTRVLSCATGPESTSDLPSWVPDWRRIKNNRPFVLYSGQTGFCASSSMPVEAWHSNRGKVLHMIGEVVDTVNTVGSEPKFCKIGTMYPVPGKSITKLAQLCQWLVECHRLASDIEGGLSDQRYKQFWRTMTCGLTGGASPVTSEYETHFKRYWDFFFVTPRGNATPPSQIKIKNTTDMKGGTLPNDVSNLSESDPGAFTHALIESSLENWASRRRFSTTSEGRLAFMPPEAQKGDLICILYGGEVPYVLRPQGPESPDKYVVIGECYVDGIMHGEALSGQISRERHFKLV
jgi:hypothetical protein